jgi:hypothetical protein
MDSRNAGGSSNANDFCDFHNALRALPRRRELDFADLSRRNFSEVTQTRRCDKLPHSLV